MVAGREERAAPPTKDDRLVPSMNRLVHMNEVEGKGCYFPFFPHGTHTNITNIRAQ